MVGYLGMMMFTARAPGDGMAVAIWGTGSGWTLTALLPFLWMGRSCFVPACPPTCFAGWRPGWSALPGRLLHQHHRLHAVRGGFRLFGRHLCNDRQDQPARKLAKRGYPRVDDHRYAGRCRHLGLLIPPSIIMIGMGFRPMCRSPAVHRRGLWLLLASLFMGWVVLWSLLNKTTAFPQPTRRPPSSKFRLSASLIPVALLIGAVLGSIYLGIATATEAAALGVLGSFVIAATQGAPSRGPSSPTSWARRGCTA